MHGKLSKMNQTLPESALKSADSTLELAILASILQISAYKYGPLSPIPTVAAGTSPHPRSSQAASTVSDWSDVLNLDSVSFTD